MYVYVCIYVYIYIYIYYTYNRYYDQIIFMAILLLQYTPLQTIFMIAATLPLSAAGLIIT